MSHEMWNPQVEFLKQSFRVVAYDIRGHGQSDVGDGQYTMELFAEDLLGLLDSLRIEKAVLCGLSMGGYIALRTAEKSQERVGGLILCDTKAEADSDEAKLKRATTIRFIKEQGMKPFIKSQIHALLASQTVTKNPATVEMVRRIIQGNSPIGVCGALLAMAGRTDTSAALPNLKVKTLIIVGENDALTPPELSKSMHAKIPNSTLHVLRNAGHLSNLEKTEDFNHHLSDFLSKLH
ncbi:alpha/beta fold hydrolase [Candidatus Bathyarchaeota archaeon]|nr:MAG: alpha/beta fold hydrolase [Candidatus Bathyarchaeota archaeon]TMI30084.1 MAG: alpha/beta fold hydrolase [Candidatus Bathyarchaeota archaeon]